MTAVLVQLAYVSSGILARIGSGVVAFILLARALSPADFGFFTTCVAVAALVALPVNLGMGILILKQSLLSKADFAEFLRSALKLKFCLAVSVAALSATLGLVLQNAGFAVFMLLLFAALVESFTELIYAALRTRELNRLEAALTLTQALLVMLCMVLAVEFFATLNLLVLAYLLPRGVMFFIAFAFAWRRFVFGLFGGVPVPVSRLFSESLANFAELCAQTILVQLDTIILASSASPQQVAVYQAVMRIVHGISNLITVFLNVFLPRISKLPDANDRDRLVKRVTFILSGFGLFFALLLAGGAATIDSVMYASKFEGIRSVVYIAAVLLFIRFIAAGFGIGMIARSDNRARLFGIFLGLFALATLGWPLSREYGAIGMMATMASAFALILAAAMFTAKRGR